jgi:hypothetical protein
LKIIRREVSDLVPVQGDSETLELRPGNLGGSPVNDICVIQEVRTALSYAWDSASSALFGDGDFRAAAELLRSVLRDLFTVTVRIDGDTSRIAKSIEDLLSILETPPSGQLPREQRESLIRAINKIKREFKQLELRTAEPSPVKRGFKLLFGGPIKLDASPETVERARALARTVLKGISDEIARRVNVDEDVRKALRAYNLNVWSTVEEYRTKRNELFLKYHPDHGGDSEVFQRYHQQSKILDVFFESAQRTASTDGNAAGSAGRS